MSPDSPIPVWQRPVIVTGVLSPAGFLNHPDAKICHHSGVRLGAHRTLRLVPGHRPPLGVLVADDGTTITVDHDMILGRSPAADHRAETGLAEAVVLPDSTRQMSRHHLWVRLTEWSVAIVDLGGRNGTRIDRATETIELSPAIAFELMDGDLIRAGGRALRWRARYR